MVNSAGVELTMDFIIRDVFMLENQIPTYFLKQVQEVVILITIDDAIESLEEKAYKDIGSTMKELCESLCPFVHEFQLSKNPEDHDHLLDLMYHLIVPKLKETKDKGEPNRKADRAEHDPKDDQTEPNRKADQAEHDRKADQAKHDQVAPNDNADLVEPGRKADQTQPDDKKEV
ncbi:hypothetical protein TSUD_179170 [Trifolium subterraneum]|uniref:Uncharacterized protein n=1 Tax=Trifolium subterraneum TaxID=3900 RepID=A0A2Z6LVS3_TRISU|nr:hypothetical protein TSUD_179170 [Trifolium subterraneum]